MKKIIGLCAAVMAVCMLFAACGGKGDTVSPSYNGPRINVEETAQKLYPMKVDNTDDKGKVDAIIENLPFAEGLTISSSEVVEKEDGTLEVLVKYDITDEKYVLRDGLMIEDPSWRNMALTLALCGEVPSVRFVIGEGDENVGEFYWLRNDAEEYLGIKFAEVTKSEEAFEDFVKKLSKWHQ